MCSNEFEEIGYSESVFYEIVESRVLRRNFTKCVSRSSYRQISTIIFNFSFKKYFKTPADKETIDSIYMTAWQGIVDANRFKNDYVMYAFSQPFSQVHPPHRKTYYSWLRGDFKMPKELNENMTEAHLKSLLREPQEVVVGMYQLLQRFAVAFEVMLSEHAEHGDKFRHEFEEAEINLKLLLCEIREFIDEDRLKSYRDIDRSIMKDELRRMKNHGQRHFRDWLIFRDYMNLLEYILQVMAYFKQVIQINAS